MIFSRLAGALIALSVLAACTSVPRLVTEYRIDVQQGNVLTQEMVSQLRPGLSQDQVRFILGTPILTDLFHANRWDYFFWLRKGSTGTVETRRFSVFFDADGKLVRVAGDVTAASSDDPAKPVESRRREMDLSALPTEGGQTVTHAEEPGFFRRMLDSVGL